MIVTNKTHENELIEFNVNVTVREKTYKIFCSSRQKIRWLIDVAMHKYDRNFAFNSGKLLIIIGLPYAVKLDSNDLCSIEENINTILRNNDHITILLKEYDNYIEENKKKSNRTVSKSPATRKLSINKIPKKNK